MASEYYDSNYAQLNQRTGPTFKAPDGRQTATGASIDVIPATEVAAGRIYRVTRANFNVERNTPQKYFDFFVQDQLQLGRLTVQPGHPLRTGEDERHDHQGLGAEEQLGTAPRGDVRRDGDGKTKIYGNYGRF
jgi:hypothetical protein